MKALAPFTPKIVVSEDEEQARALAEAVEKFTTDLSAAQATLAGLSAAREAAYLLNDGDGDEALDKLDAREKKARRSLEKATLVLPKLERNLEELNGQIVQRKINRHREIAKQTFAELTEAFAGFVEMNIRAIRKREEAERELGSNRVSEIPVISHPHGLWSVFNYWWEFTDKELSPVRPAAPADSMSILFKQPWGPFQPGEIASFDEKNARHIVEHLAGEIVDGSGEILDGALPADSNPRKAEPPEPNSEGTIAVVFVRVTQVVLGVGPVGYVPGDIATFSPELAVKLVRAGRAEFVYTAVGEV